MSRCSTRRLRLERLEGRVLLHGAPTPLFEAADSSTSPALLSIGEGEGELVADFSLRDVNPTSATFDQAISPRDFVGQVSGWYFGHST